MEVGEINSVKVRKKIFAKLFIKVGAEKENRYEDDHKYANECY